MMIPNITFPMPLLLLSSLLLHLSPLFLSFINNGPKFVLQQLKRYTPMENWNRCDNAKPDQMGGSTKSDFWYTFQIVFRGHTN